MKSPRAPGGQERFGLKTSDNDLFGADKYIPEKPGCPKGGIYSLEPVGTKATCSIQEHWF